MKASDAFYINGAVMAEKHPHHTNCPFITQPLAGCRVQVITGQTIPQILECCGDRFAECPLYRNKLAEKTNAMKLAAP